MKKTPTVMKSLNMKEREEQDPRGSESEGEGKERGRRFGKKGTHFCCWWVGKRGRLKI